MVTLRATRWLCTAGLLASTACAEDPCAGVVCVEALPHASAASTLDAAPRSLDGYACDPALRLDGAEVIHRVTLPTDGFFVARTDGGTTTLALLGDATGATLLGTPEAAPCIDLHAHAVGARLPAGDYYVVVDSPAGSEGAFSLRMALTTVETFEAHGVDPQMAADALTVIGNAWAWGATRRTEYAVIDFTQHAAEEREWIFDLSTGALLHQLRVAHGRRSTDGVDLAHAVTFSNESGSNQSSLGLYRSAGPYVGTFGPSFRLEGLEPGWNDAVCARDIVMHPWAPMGDDYVARCGWARPSLGCPAIDSTLSMPVRDLMARPDGTSLDEGVLMLFWYPGTDWHARSSYLHDSTPSSALLAQMAQECDSSTDGTPDPPASGDYACD